MNIWKELDTKTKWTVAGLLLFTAAFYGTIIWAVIRFIVWLTTK
jgi:hypothetical protein